MKLEVKAEVLVKEGQHEGVIIGVDYREEPFKYTDLIIETGGVKLKAGYPTYVSKKSELGLMLMRFGQQLEEGESIDPDCLIGLKCKFLVEIEETKKGSFSKIINSSVKPC